MEGQPRGAQAQRLRLAGGQARRAPCVVVDRWPWERLSEEVRAPPMHQLGGGLWQGQKPEEELHSDYFQHLQASSASRIRREEAGKIDSKTVKEDARDPSPGGRPHENSAQPDPGVRHIILYDSSDSSVQGEDEPQNKLGVPVNLQGPGPPGSPRHSRTHPDPEILYLADQSWARSQYLELIPREGASLVDKDEMLMASKEQNTEHRMKASPNPNGREARNGGRKGENKRKRERQEGPRPRDAMASTPRGGQSPDRLDAKWGPERFRKAKEPWRAQEPRHKAFRLEAVTCGWGKGVRWPHPQCPFRTLRWSRGMPGQLAQSEPSTCGRLARLGQSRQGHFQATLHFRGSGASHFGITLRHPHSPRQFCPFTLSGRAAPHLDGEPCCRRAWWSASYPHVAHHHPDPRCGRWQHWLAESCCLRHQLPILYRLGQTNLCANQGLSVSHPRGCPFTYMARTLRSNIVSAGTVCGALRWVSLRWVWQTPVIKDIWLCWAPGGVHGRLGLFKNFDGLAQERTSWNPTNWGLLDRRNQSSIVAPGEPAPPAGENASQCPTVAGEGNGRQMA